VRHSFADTVGPSAFALVAIVAAVAPIRRPASVGTVGPIRPASAGVAPIPAVVAVRIVAAGVAAIVAAAFRHRTVGRSVAASSVDVASHVGSADPNRRLAAGVVDTVAVGVASVGPNLAVVGVASVDTSGVAVGPKRYPAVGSAHTVGVASVGPIAHSAEPSPAAARRHSAPWALLVGVVQQAGALLAPVAVSLAVVRRFSPAAALASS
jgi:hypothetical protein